MFAHQKDSGLPCFKCATDPSSRNVVEAVLIRICPTIYYDLTCDGEMIEDTKVLLRVKLKIAKYLMTTLS